MKLSKRLSAVAKMVPVNTTLVDVGTDHAYLPVYLCEQGICPHVVASDVAPVLWIALIVVWQTAYQL